MARDACFEKTVVDFDNGEGYQNEIYTPSSNGLAGAEWLNANQKSCDDVNHLRFTIVGLIFLVFGILPGVYFGKYGALLLLKNLPGGAVESTLLVNATVVAGIGVGIICAAAISVVIAGLLCTAVDYITRPARR